VADTADLLYLIAKRDRCEALLLSSHRRHRYGVEPARPGDEAPIIAIARAHQPPGPGP